MERHRSISVMKTHRVKRLFASVITIKVGMTVDASNWNNCVFLERNGYLEKIETGNANEIKVDSEVEIIEQAEQTEILAESSSASEIEPVEQVLDKVEKPKPFNRTPKKRSTRAKAT